MNCSCSRNNNSSSNWYGSRLLPLPPLPLLLYSLLILTSHSAFSQHFNLINFNSLHGLPSSECYGMVQDPKGYIWIAGDAGVSRFDGKNFRVYTTADGLPDNAVLKIAAGQSGKIWFFCSNGSIAYHENDSIYPLPCNNELRKLNADGKYYFLYGFADEKENIRFYYSGNGRGGLITSSDGFKTIIPVADTVTDGALFHETGNNYIYFHGTLPPGQSGINVYIKTETLSGKYHIHPIISPESKVPSTTFFKMIRAGKGLFMSTNDLLYRLENDTHYLFKKFNSGITHLSMDINENLCVGTQTGGFLFRGFAEPGECRPVLTGQTVTSVINDHEKGYWFSTRENGIYYMRSPDALIIDQSENIAPDPVKRAIRFDSSLIFYHETSPRPFMIRIKDNQAILNLNYDYKGGHQRCLFKHNNSIVSLGFNMNINDDATGKSKSLTPLPGSELTQGFSINKEYFCVFNPRALFICDEEGQLRKIKVLARITDGMNFTIAGPVFSTVKGLYTIRGDSMLKISDNVTGSIRFNALSEGPDGNIYAVSSDKGIFVFSPSLEKLFIIPHSHFGKGSICRDLLIWDDSTGYVATTKGVYQIRNIQSSQTYSVRHINTSSGFSASETYSLEKLNDYLFVLTGREIIYAKPEQFMTLKGKPLVNLEYVSQDGGPQKLANRASIFNYENGNLKFVLSGISFSSAGKVKFLYKLDGMESKWNSTIAPEISYSNLYPGTYSFRVIVEDQEGNRSEELVYTFTLLPPFYMTWWFYSLTALSFTAIAVFVVKRIIHKIREKDRKKAELNQKLAEFQLTALKSQMNPHFIFNCMSSIQQLILSGQNDEAYEYLNRFSVLTRMVLDYSRTDLIPLSEELVILTNYIELEKMRFDGGFTYSITLDEHVSKDSMIPNMLLQPFVENALWHGLRNSDKNKKLEVKFYMEKGMLTVSVADNGIGRTKAGLLKKESGRRKSSIGIANTAERISLINRKNNLNVSFRIEDKLEESGHGCGTTVFIQIPLHTHSPKTADV